MNKRIQGFIIGVLIYLLVFGGATFAAEIYKQLEVTYRDIKIEIDGETITPKDAAGNIVEPFASNGTTYLPVRAIGEALGKEVDWDNETSTVIIKDKELKKVYLYDITPGHIHFEEDFYKKEFDSVKYIGFRPFKGMQRTNFSSSNPNAVYYIYENQMSFTIPEGATYFSGEVTALDENGEEPLSDFVINIYNDKGGLLLSNVSGEFELNVSDLTGIVFKCEGTSLTEDALPCVIKDAIFYIKS